MSPSMKIHTPCIKLQELLKTEFNKKKFVSCLDEAGVGLLHKAIYYDFTDIAEWLVQNFPHLVSQRDSVCTARQ